MSEYPTYSQWLFGQYRKFEFKPDILIYTAKDYSAEYKYSIPYERIRILEPESMALNSLMYARKLFGIPVLLFLGAAAAAQYSRALSDVLMWSAGIFLAAIYCGQWLGIFRVKYTTMLADAAPGSTVNHRLSVIADRKHDTIVEEISGKWRLRHKELYGRLDLSNDPDREIAKFGWLKDHAIINDTEYSEAIERLQNIKVQIAEGEAQTRSVN